jgi:hypothetical protein
MARIGGAFPLPLAQIQEGTNKIELDSGGLFYFPAGEYAVLTDANSVIELFDGVEQTWRTFIAVSTGGYLSADGSNFRARNITGTVESFSLTAGSAMTNGIGAAATGVAASIAASNTTGYPTATVYTIIGGSVQAPTITQAGSGFLVAPLVVIDPPPQGGIQATAYATLTAGGGINSIVMVNVGGGYAAAPNFYLIPQPNLYQGGPSGGVAAGAIPAPGLVYPTNAVPGNQNTSSTGAQLTPNALTGSGTLTGLHIINHGGGYTSANPTVTFTGGAGGVAATATVSTTTLARALVLSQPRIQ